MFRDFFLGFIKIHILHHAAEEPIYGLAMIEELGGRYEISPPPRRSRGGVKRRNRTKREGPHLPV